MHKLLIGKPQGLIFDLDGTLIDSLELNWRAMDTALREWRIEIGREEFISQTGRAIEEIVHTILQNHGRQDADVRAIVSRKKQIASQHAGEVREIEAVADVARCCHGRIPMSVGTGSDRHRALLMLESTGLLGLFDHVVAADDVEFHKPHPQTFLRCAELMGVRPADCQVFEDGDPGLQAAKAAGMSVLDVRCLDGLFL